MQITSETISSLSRLCMFSPSFKLCRAPQKKVSCIFSWNAIFRNKLKCAKKEVFCENCRICRMFTIPSAFNYLFYVFRLFLCFSSAFYTFCKFCCRYLDSKVVSATCELLQVVASLWLSCISCALEDINYVMLFILFQHRVEHAMVMQHFLQLPTFFKWIFEAIQ